MSVGLEAVAAVHSFLHGCALRHPEHAALVQQVLAIPPKRAEKRTITFLNLTRADAHLGTRSPRARPRQRTQGARRPAHAPDRRGAARLDPRDRGRARGLAVSFSSRRAAYPRRGPACLPRGPMALPCCRSALGASAAPEAGHQIGNDAPTARRRNAGVAPVVPSAHSETVGAGSESPCGHRCSPYRSACPWVTCCCDTSGDRLRDSREPTAYRPVDADGSMVRAAA